jgi:hypothetical protein
MVSDTVLEFFMGNWGIFGVTKKNFLSWNFEKKFRNA